jgi:hypothetical protein
VAQSDALVKELKNLGPQDLERVGALVRELREPAKRELTDAERQARWQQLAGTLTNEEAERMLAVIEQEFERVDESSR